MGGEVVAVNEMPASLAGNTVAGVQKGMMTTCAFAGIPVRVSLVVSTVRVEDVFAVTVKVWPSFGFVVVAGPINA